MLPCWPLPCPLAVRKKKLRLLTLLLLRPLKLLLLKPLLRPLKLLLPRLLTLLLRPLMLLLRLLTLLLRLKLRLLRLLSNLWITSQYRKGVVFGPRPFCLRCMGSETKLPRYQ